MKKIGDLSLKEFWKESEIAHRYYFRTIGKKCDDCDFDLGPICMCDILDGLQNKKEFDKYHDSIGEKIGMTITEDTLIKDILLKIINKDFWGV